MAVAMYSRFRVPILCVAVSDQLQTPKGEFLPRQNL